MLKPLLTTLIVPTGTIFNTATVNTPVLKANENPIIRVNFNNASASASQVIDHWQKEDNDKTSDIEIIKWNDINQMSKDEFIKAYPTMKINLNAKLEGHYLVNKEMNGDFFYDTKLYLTGPEKKESLIERSFVDLAVVMKMETYIVFHSDNNHCYFTVGAHALGISHGANFKLVAKVKINHLSFISKD